MKGASRGRFLAVAVALALVPSAAPAQDPERSAIAELKAFAELLKIGHERSARPTEYRELVYSALHGVMRQLDPHTSFLTPETYQNKQSRQSTTYFGVGILVSKRNGRLVIIAPIDGTPAARKGLRPGDEIQAVDGEATAQMTIDQVISRIRGEEGTEVELRILHVLRAEEATHFLHPPGERARLFFQLVHPAGAIFLRQDLLMCAMHVLLELLDLAQVALDEEEPVAAEHGQGRRREQDHSLVHLGCPGVTLSRRKACILRPFTSWVNDSLTSRAGSTSLPLTASRKRTRLRTSSEWPLTCKLGFG